MQRLELINVHHVLILFQHDLKNVALAVLHYEMPDTGNLHIDFVANLNTIQVPVSLISGGTWYLVNNDSTLVLDNDSVSYAFKMISGLPTQQIWQTSFMQVPADSSYWADIDLELTLIK